MPLYVIIPTRSRWLVIKADRRSFRKKCPHSLVAGQSHPYRPCFRHLLARRGTHLAYPSTGTCLFCGWRRARTAGDSKQAWIIRAEAEAEALALLRLRGTVARREAHLLLGRRRRSDHEVTTMACRRSSVRRRRNRRASRSTSSPSWWRRSRTSSAPGGRRPSVQPCPGSKVSKKRVRACCFFFWCPWNLCVLIYSVDYSC
jgi:hypothetical protein